MRECPEDAPDRAFAAVVLNSTARACRTPLLEGWPGMRRAAYASLSDVRGYSASARRQRGQRDDVRC
jgi:hypothetical protein